MKLTKGGQFLLQATAPDSIFTPEEAGKRMELYHTAHRYITEKVLPNLEAIDNHQFDISVALLKELGQMGMYKIDTPDSAGMQHDIITTMLVTEAMGGGGSFSVSFAVQTGIGVFPVQYYGTPEQKAKYLPKLLSGEIIGAYALTEPTSGSDALGAKTTAVLDDDGGHYVLNGRKQFITNAGFADLFTVFAKIDGEHFSAFLIEKDTPGLSTGPEERKMGIRGSSTRRLILENVRVPKENLLGEIGKGHKIAFNALNLGRFKLGAAVLGGAKRALSDAAKRANSRKQFGMPIANFGLIQGKLADMTARIYATESVVYRLAGQIADHVSLLDKSAPDYPEKYLRIIEDFSAECAISKVFGSESLAAVVDHTVQIYGGYGFLEAFPAERYYRDERINRIYEGTNEINRLLATSTLLKKGMKGDLPLIAAAKAAGEKLITPSFDELPDTPFAEEVALIEGLKTLGLALAGAATQKYGLKLAEEQETLAAVADIMIPVYAMESAILRAMKHTSRPDAALHAAVARHFIFHALPAVSHAALVAAHSVAEGDMLSLFSSGVRRFTRYSLPGLIPLTRMAAAETLKHEGYPFGSISDTV